MEERINKNEWTKANNVRFYFMENRMKMNLEAAMVYKRIFSFKKSIRLFNSLRWLMYIKTGLWNKKLEDIVFNIY